MGLMTCGATYKFNGNDKDCGKAEALVVRLKTVSREGPRSCMTIVHEYLSVPNHLTSGTPRISLPKNLYIWYSCSSWKKRVEWNSTLIATFLPLRRLAAAYISPEMVYLMNMQKKWTHTIRTWTNFTQDPIYPQNHCFFIQSSNGVEGNAWLP